MVSSHSDYASRPWFSTLYPQELHHGISEQSAETKNIRRTVELAYRISNDGARSDNVRCSDEKREWFDHTEQTLCRIEGFSLKTESASRILLGLRKADVLGPSTAT